MKLVYLTLFVYVSIKNGVSAEWTDEDFAQLKDGLYSKIDGMKAELEEIKKIMHGCLTNPCLNEGTCLGILICSYTKNLFMSFCTIFSYVILG